MSFQIAEIVLYSHDGRRRVVSLGVGRVNVITGGSKTGKSALAHIVDYCLGSNSCAVPEGIIRKTVAWYGLRLQLADGSQAFVARKAPRTGGHSSTDAYYEHGSSVVAPEPSELRSTTNRDGLLAFLNSVAGIGRNLHEPPPGQTRASLAANIRHALSFAYQPQDVILRREQLFHNQGESWEAQAIKDTLPYFLGAVDDDHLAKRDELRRLKRELKDKERRLATLESVRGRGLGKAAGLLAEAADLGLTDPAVVPESFEEAVQLLTAVVNAPVEQQLAAAERGPDSREYDRLMRRRQELQEALRRVRWELDTAKALIADGSGYDREAREQVARLKSIELLPEEPSEGAQQHCPLCQTALAGSVADVEELEAAIRATSDQLERVSRRAPQLETWISTAEDRIQEFKRQLAENREGLEAIRASHERLAALRESSSRRAHVVGRISLFVESIPETADTSQERSELELLRQRITSLEADLSDDAVNARMDSFLSLIGRDLTERANMLGLEHAQYPLRFDARNLTVVADSADGPIPMARMGSAENWVGYHLVTHFTLHRWFVEKDRPVPRFLFLDQPSEVYFPTDVADERSLADLADDDRAEVLRMFRMAFDFVNELAPGFQLVVTEHADIAEEWYQEAVVERWRGGQKLVPDDWLDDDGAAE